jgi:hypothetical protein
MDSSLTKLSGVLKVSVMLLETANLDTWDLTVCTFRIQNTT